MSERHAREINRRGFLRTLAAGGLLAKLGCAADSGVPLPGRESDAFDPTGLRLLARFAHISDTHIIDTQSPARFPVGQVVTRSAWRPYEAYSTQIVDGILRTINRIHASGRTIDFVLHTGDGVDNVHGIELSWLLDLFDGTPFTPLSGPDDRSGDQRPPAELDPYAAFVPAGLYRQGVHGPAPTIPWYTLTGNHDAYAIGLFPWYDVPAAGRIAPLPLVPGSEIVIPAYLNPQEIRGFGAVSPARPGPPGIELASLVAPNAARAYFDKREFARRLRGTISGPAGHGFGAEDDARSWFSVSSLPGLRLIGLDTSDQVHRIPGFLYVDGCISPAQAAFLREELAAAAEAGEVVVVASHHPSDTLQPVYSGAFTPESFRALLGDRPGVAAHLCGHQHRNRVVSRGAYLEIETCSTIDPPQEGRLIELYRDDATGRVHVAYEMFSHIDDSLPILGTDPLLALRQQALAIALADAGSAARQKLFDPSGARAAGRGEDRFVSLARTTRG